VSPRDRLLAWWHNRKPGPSGASRGERPTPHHSPPPSTGTPTAPLQAEVVQPEDFVGSDRAHNEQVVKEGFLNKARRYLRHLPMADEAVAGYFCMLDARTPVWVKGTVAAALAYFILPTDAIPDILPVIGLSDDAAVLTAALTAITSHLTDEHRSRARQWLQTEQIATTPPAAAASGPQAPPRR
jgi:uncharacterized membrane protein YkvA (DUF1232 family)